MTQLEASFARKDIWNSIYVAVDMSYYIGEGLTHYKALPEEDNIDVFRKRQYKDSINDNINRRISAETSVLNKLNTYIHNKASRSIIIDYFNIACNQYFKMGLVYPSPNYEAKIYGQLEIIRTYSMEKLHKLIEKELMKDE